ncbi:MAG TPA: hypothetical protein VFM93_08410 [Candidatus Limnocylindria bacterium]|nr:hypothetical protein [Candidatus Limnocylindria bacterium]
MNVRIAAALLGSVALLVMQGTAALSAPAPRLSATYAATVPATATAGSTISVPVTVQNTGDETWSSTGPGPVLLAYHWESSGGAILVWEGLRTALGGDVAPGASRTLAATVAVPAYAGDYQLRFHLVKEGVVWFPTPATFYPVKVEAPYAVRFGSVPIFTYVTGTTHTVQVPITNIGTTTWNASGAAPIVLSYHWHDSAGRTLVWDGSRTALPADVAPGATTTLTARVRTPDAGLGASSSVRLTLDLVREGVAWFEFLGGTPVRFFTTIEGQRFSARYDAPGTFDIKANAGPTMILQVTVTNTGNVTWEQNGPFAVSYHVFDGDGRLIVWDGRRTSIGGELRPGESRTIAVFYDQPQSAGTYFLNTEVVREGIAWLSQYGSPPAQTRLNVLP